VSWSPPLLPFPSRIWHSLPYPSRSCSVRYQQS